MISEESEFYEVTESFLVVLDSAIPTQIGVNKYSLQEATVNKSDLIFDLQVPIQKSLEDISLQCSVKSAVIPNSQYIINKTNSYFAIGLTHDGAIVSGTPLLLVLTEGNYDAESLRQHLETVIINGFNNDPTFSNIFWTVQYDPIKFSYKFNMDTTDVNFDQFFISMQPVDLGTKDSVSQLGTVIGFINDYRYFSGNSVETLNTYAIFSNITRVIQAPYPSNLSGLRSINVIIQNYNTESISISPYNSQLGFASSIKLSNFNNSTTRQFFRNNIICNIVCNANPMEYIFYEKSSSFCIDLKEPTVSRLHVMLTDVYGNQLQLNNQDWTITLEFSLIKKKEFKTKSFYEYLTRN
jgi:hypothetical protein